MWTRRDGSIEAFHFDQVAEEIIGIDVDPEVAALLWAMEPLVDKVKGRRIFVGRRPTHRDWAARLYYYYVDDGG